MQKQQKKRESRFLRGITRIFNVRLWSDTDRLKSNWNYIVNSIKNLFVVQSKTAEETFEEAKVRLNLSDEEISKRQQSLFQLSILMIIIGLLLFIYMIFQLFYGHLPGVLLTFSLACLAVVMAFRYHFWYFQMREKKLGCSVREWFKYGLLGEKR